MNKQLVCIREFAFTKFYLKKYEHVRDFVGALQGKESKGARKGVFITTSSFTKDGRDYVEGIKDGKVILIDGEQLAELMYDNGVGVSVDRIIRTNKIDEDFFE